MPFVLQVETVEPCGDRAVIDDWRKRNIAGLTAAHSAAGKHQFVVVDFRPLAAEVEAGAQGVAIEQPIAGVALQTAGPTAAEDSRRGAVVDQVALVIGIKRQCGVTAEGGELVVKPRPERSLPGQHTVVILLELIFVKVYRRIERHTRQLVDLRLTGTVGNLEMIDGGPGNQAEALRGAQEIREVPKPLTLVGLVVIGAGTRGRRLHAQLVLQILACKVIVEIFFGAAELEAGLQRRVLAAVQVEVAAAEAQAAAGMDVDYGSGLVAVLSRQSTGQKVDALGEAGIVDLAEIAADTLRHLDTVDAVLDVAVLAAHMNLAVSVLGYTGRLQEHLVERGVVALGQVPDGLAAEAIDAAAGLRRQFIACRFQPLGDHRQAQRLLRLHRQRQLYCALLSHRYDFNGGLEVLPGRD